MKKIITFAIALLLAAGCEVPAVRPACASAEEITAVNTSENESVLTDFDGVSIDEIKAFDYKIDTYLIFKDGSELKLDAQLEKTVEDNGIINYSKKFTREQMDKIFVDAGKKYEDFDHPEYRLTISNGEGQEFTDEYFVKFSQHGYLNVLKEGEESKSVNSLRSSIQQFGSEKAYSEVTDNYEDPVSREALLYRGSLTDDFQYAEFVFSMSFDDPACYIPGLANKAALKAEFTPRIMLRRSGGDEKLAGVEFETYLDSSEGLGMKAYISREDLDQNLGYDDFLVLDQFSMYYTIDYPKNVKLSKDSYLKEYNIFAVVMPVLKDGKASWSEFTWDSTFEQTDEVYMDGYFGVTSSFDKIKGYRIVDGKYEEFELKTENIEGFEFYILIDRSRAELITDNIPEEIFADENGDEVTTPDEDTPSQDDETTTPEETSADTRKLGDVNNDGKRNAGDITKIAAHIKGIKTLPEADRKYADINSDSRINAADITKLAAHIKGIKLIDIK